MLSQRQDFLINHLAKGPINPKQHGTTKLRVELLSSVEAEDIRDTSWHQACDLENIEFHWKDHDLKIDAVF